MKVLLAMFLMTGIIALVSSGIREHFFLKELKENNKRLKKQNNLLQDEIEILKTTELNIKEES